ncbi:MAG: hypothetical protein ACO39Q_08275 [Ilumatobacteraceae bacterium]
MSDSRSWKLGATRSRWAAIGAAVAVTLGAGGLVSVGAISSNDRVFIETPPIRILDTRRDGEKVSNETYGLQVTGDDVVVYLDPPVDDGTGTLISEVPARVVDSNASSVSVNITVTEGTRNAGYGFVTAFPCADPSDAKPNSSILNFVEGVDVANAATVQLGATGMLCLNVYGSAHVIVDLMGYYVPAGTTQLASGKDLDELVERVEVLESSADSGTTGGELPECDASQVLIYGESGDAVVCGNTTFGPTGPLGSTAQWTSAFETSSFALDDDGQAIAAVTMGNGKVALVECEYGLTECEEFQTIVPDNAQTRYLNARIALLPDGSPFVLAAKTTGGVSTIFTYVCDDPTCATAVETSHSPKLLTSDAPTDLVIAVDGTARIVYVNEDSKARLMECLEADCAAADTYAFGDIEVSMVAEQQLHAAMKPDGGLVWSYYDPVPQTTFMTVCGAADSTCNVPSTRSQISLGRESLARPSADIAITSDGRPIAVWDENGEIAITECLDTMCDAFNEHRSELPRLDWFDLNIGLTADDVPVVVGAVGNRAATGTVAYVSPSCTRCEDPFTFTTGQDGVRKVMLATSPSGHVMRYGHEVFDGNAATTTVEFGLVNPPAVTGIRVDTRSG